MGLTLLRATRPDWFEIEEDRADQLSGEACIVIAGAATDFVIQLRIWEESTRVCVSERGASRILPGHCPERHINADGSFCLGYGAERLPVSADGARVWWGLLEAYLGYQRTAGRTRRWPPNAFISHGDAGKHHLAAAEAARHLGLHEQYEQLLAGTPCWIDDGSIKVVKDGQRLVNGRGPCPVGCRKMNKPRLRRKCCKKGIVLELMAQERLRKKEESKFWEALQSKGAVCCGTMISCPLKHTSTTPTERIHAEEV